jgi:hypothetical protein
MAPRAVRYVGAEAPTPYESGARALAICRRPEGLRFHRRAADGDNATDGRAGRALDGDGEGPKDLTPEGVSYMKESGC